MEIWKPVKNYEGIYEVSNLGRVRRQSPGKGTYIGRILSTPPDTDGYPRVRLSKNNIQKDISVHCLVASAFLGDCPNGMEINHKDLNRTNNHSDNLEYLTHSKNQLHAAEMRKAWAA